MLEAKKLYCERDDRVLFSDLDLTLPAGQATQISGSNGSGKTTLLRILCGLNHEYLGELSWHGESVSKARSSFLSNVFYLGHNPAINKSLSPVENLRWFCASRGVDEGDRIPAVLKEMGLAGYDDVPCYMMSAGQQRRVSLARLKLTDARLWILDEPFTALDIKGVSDLESLLSDFVTNNGSLLVTTHHDLSLSCPIQEVNLDQREKTLREDYAH